MMSQAHFFHNIYQAKSEKVIAVGDDNDDERRRTNLTFI